MLRWKKRRYNVSPGDATQYLLRDTVTGTIVAAVQQIGDSKWVWYTLRGVKPAMNSCRTPAPMLEARAECIKYVKEHRRDDQKAQEAAVAAPGHEG